MNYLFDINKLIVIHIAMIALHFYIFGISRTSLLIFRENQIPDLESKVLFPPKLIAVNIICTIAKWGSLGLLIYLGAYTTAAVLFFIGIFIAFFAPIPYKIYKKTLMNEALRIRKTDYEAGESLLIMINSSRLFK